MEADTRGREQRAYEGHQRKRGLSAGLGHPRGSWGGAVCGHPLRRRLHGPRRGDSGESPAIIFRRRPDGKTSLS